MFHYTEDWGDAAVRRFIVRVGEENLDELYRLRFADSFGTTGMDPEAGLLLPLVNRVEDILSGNGAFSLKDLAVSGKDLIASGIKPGKYMGIILKGITRSGAGRPGAEYPGKIAGNSGKDQRAVLIFAGPRAAVPLHPGSRGRDLNQEAVFLQAVDADQISFPALPHRP
jgi:hypothetical protein